MIEGLPALPVSATPHEKPPSSIQAWTDFEFNVLQTLTLRIKILSHAQISRLWGTANRQTSAVSQTLTKLCSAGLLERYVINVPSPLGLTKPIAHWQLGDETLDGEYVSHLAKSRWKRPGEPTEVCVASKKAANLFGSNSLGLPSIDHRLHALVLADAYIASQSNSPNLNWNGDQYFQSPGSPQSAPFAVLSEGGSASRAILSAGMSGECRINAIHDRFSNIPLPYELW